MTVREAVDKLEEAFRKLIGADTEALKLVANECCWEELFDVLRKRSNASNLMRWICENICEKISLNNGWSLFIRAWREGLVQFKDFSSVVYDVHRLRPERWLEAPAELRKDAIYELFERRPGEPFESIRHAHASGGQVLVPPIGYIPDVSVRRFREMVQASGDTESLALIDELIQERKAACLVAVHHSSSRPLVLTSAERELVARLFSLARQGGFRSAPLPPIHLSYELPPIFLAYPELEEDGQEREEDTPIPRDRQRGRPETMSIEELLGCYQADASQITLWVRGIRWFARRLGKDEEMLRAVVLVHELGHWIMHRLTKAGVEEWPLSLYKLTHEDLHECWAQLQTWYVGRAVGGAFQATFADLNKHQPAAYRVWERFQSVPPVRAFSALEFLRRLPWPARLQDWESRVQ
jgi:hypothetical protein